jgi:hypothetical protein
MAELMDGNLVELKAALKVDSLAASMGSNLVDSTVAVMADSKAV